MVESWGGAEQGKVFMFIDLAVIGLCMMIILDVDYYVAYQIMSFGQCLYSLSKNDD